MLLNYFLKLPPVKAFQFALEVGLGIGRTFIPIHNNNGITHLPPVYTFKGESLFRLNLQAIHTKAVKVDDV